MPGQSGLDLQETLCADGWIAPIVFITGHGNVPMSVRAMRGGAVNFLQKPFEDQAILDAIREAVERGRLERAASAGGETRSERSCEALTPREREVFALVVAGLPNKRIAGRLGASEKTIKVHRGRVMVKMRAESLAELVHMAHEAGLTQAGHEADFVPAAAAELRDPWDQGPTRLWSAHPTCSRRRGRSNVSPARSDQWRRSRARRLSPSSGSS